VPAGLVELAPEPVPSVDQAPVGGHAVGTRGARIPVSRSTSPIAAMVGMTGGPVVEVAWGFRLTRAGRRVREA
jgi:hypothetical protein